MVYSARALAFLLSSSIAIIAVSCLLLIDRAGIQAIILLGIISFVGSFLLIYYVLEFLIFREINAINKMMEKLNKKEKLGISKEKSSTLNPLKRINEEIYSFAMQKQKEVDELKKLETFRKEFIAN
ncbi:MAG: two-component sensor histidine kinase, partial [Bacteroidia bacterium]|nr:two-component sensor histidine kinase [Bacteroidia bacterium]